MSISLQLEDPEGNQHRFHAEEFISIGRDPSQVTIVINSQFISRFHCVFKRRLNGEWILIHRGKNSTWIDGLRLQQPGEQAVLHDASVVRLGDVTIQTRLEKVLSKLGHSASGRPAKSHLIIDGLEEGSGARISRQLLMDEIANPSADLASETAEEVEDSDDLEENTVFDASFGDLHQALFAPEADEELAHGTDKHCWTMDFERASLDSHLQIPPPSLEAVSVASTASPPRFGAKRHRWWNVMRSWFQRVFSRSKRQEPGKDIQESG